MVFALVGWVWRELVEVLIIGVQVLRDILRVFRRPLLAPIVQLVVVLSDKVNFIILTL